jgi:HEPN domain-containing protein
MATMTVETALEPAIKIAMENIGLGERTNDLLDMLDEIKLDIALKESIEQCERGEKTSTKDVVKKIKEKLNNGYYLR